MNVRLHLRVREGGWGVRNEEEKWMRERREERRGRAGDEEQGREGDEGEEGGKEREDE